MVAAGNDSLFAKLCVLVEQESWIHDERFATNPARVLNRSVLSAKLQEIFRALPTSRWREPREI